MDLRRTLIAKTLRVPAVDGAPGDGAAVARQLDVALLSVGFKLSRELLEHLSARDPSVAADAAREVLGAARELVGAHVEHNPYFRDFPENVPDTLAFWTECIAVALLDARSATKIRRQLRRRWVNLLDLPTYGRVQHTYEEMLAAHDALIPSAHDRVTVLALGKSLAEESHALYLKLAGRRVPLSEGDLALLGELAELHAGDAQPEAIPVRENRAVVDRARLPRGLPLFADTPADILRLACALSGGDVTLTTATRFRSLPRLQRRALLEALDAIVRAQPAKLADVARHAEPFKRLGERLHPHEHPRRDMAQAVFAVARGERVARSLAGHAEIALAAGDPDGAVDVLKTAPGMLVRAADRLARAGAGGLPETMRAVAPAVSTRVLLSLREHLQNRDAPAAVRVFVNREGRTWVMPDAREPLPAETRDALAAVLDAAVASRLPRFAGLVVEPAMRTVALPLSGKSRPDGLGILPRGSVLSAAGHVRFFVHWKERERTTDYDLSVMLLDEDFQLAAQVSWTNLGEAGAVHSGDITEAPDGATEFIDVDLSAIRARYVVPQVHVYSGEPFDAAEEAFFGFMERDPAQRGRPFEPRTVRAKSDLYGAGRVALPLLFARGEGGWEAKWMHLNLRGRPRFNRVEANWTSTAHLVRGIAQRRYLDVAYLEGLLGTGGDEVAYLGFEPPDDLPAGAQVFTPANLPELLNPA